jgi:toxin YoeB
VSYKVLFADKTEEDLAKLKRAGTNHFKKICGLLLELECSPHTGTGHPEALRHMPDCYSRRIDKKNRLVYQIDEASSTVLILSVMGHYDD